MDVFIPSTLHGQVNLSIIAQYAIRNTQYAIRNTQLRINLVCENHLNIKDCKLFMKAAVCLVFKSIISKNSGCSWLRWIRRQLLMTWICLVIACICSKET